METNGMQYQEVGFNLDWNKVNDWDWTDFAEPLNINLQENQLATAMSPELELMPKIVLLYNYFVEKCNISVYDNLKEGLSLPFRQFDLGNIEISNGFTTTKDGINNSQHFGIDFASIDKSEGTEIRSIADGVIFSAISRSEDCGHCLIVKHNDSLYSLYMHMKKLEKSKGDSVKKGEIIGHMGSTGNVSRPQLHFQINTYIKDELKNGAIDPVKYFPRLTDKIKKGSLA